MNKHTDDKMILKTYLYLLPDKWLSQVSCSPERKKAIRKWKQQEPTRERMTASIYQWGIKYYITKFNLFSQSLMNLPVILYLDVFYYYFEGLERSFWESWCCMFCWCTQKTCRWRVSLLLLLLSFLLTRFWVIKQEVFY